MNKKAISGIFIVTALCISILLFFCMPLSADSNSGSYQNPVPSGVPVLDEVQYRSQATVPAEDVSDGMTRFIKRPYGYIQTSKEGHANLSIIKTRIEHDSKSHSVIKGEIKNQDDKVIDLVVITFNLYNADGAQIGNAYASIDYLSPKATWKFSTDPIERSDFQFEKYGSIYIGFFD